MLVGSRQVPAKLDGGNPVLGLRQVLSPCPGPERGSRVSDLAHRVYGGVVHSRLPAGGIDQVLSRENRVLLCGLPLLHIQRHEAHRLLLLPGRLRQNFNHLIPVKHRNFKPLHFPPKGLGHVARGQGTRGGSPLARVVVRLVAHILTHPVVRERNSDVHQVIKASGRQRSLTQRQIPVHALALKERLCHAADAVRLPATGSQLIVGLFVRAGVAGGSHKPPLRDDGDIPGALLKKTDRRV